MGCSFKYLSFELTTLYLLENKIDHKEQNVLPTGNEMSPNIKSCIWSSLAAAEQFPIAPNQATP